MSAQPQPERWPRPDGADDQVPPDAPLAPRRPWLAALLSLVLPGLGQLYNGDPNRAIWWLLLFVLGSLPVPAATALWLPAIVTGPALALALIFAVGIWILAIADAWRGARARVDHRLRAWQRSGTYVLVFLIANVITLPLVLGWVQTHLVRAFRIPSASMAPSVLPGDYLIADMRYNCPGCANAARRGDIAIFIEPNDRTRYYIKRIIGLPGDEVRIDGRHISVNGRDLSARASDASARDSDTQAQPSTECWDDRCWTVAWNGATSGPGNGASDSPGRTPDAEGEPTVFKVAAGSVFTLGDNRAASIDSRSFGTVPLRDVVGRVRQVFFSRGADGIRWSRIGLLPPGVTR
ncbi:MAG: signal peptidase I [Burkholderiaceae bacterium]